MTPPLLPNAKRSAWRRLPMVVRIILPTVLGGVLAVLLWLVGDHLSNASAIRRLEASARQRGEPLTLADVAATYPSIPDEQNAAVALVELWSSEDPPFWNAFLAGQRPLPARSSSVIDPALPVVGNNARHVSRTEPLSPAALASAEAHLATHAAHLERVRAALRRPRFRAPITITDGFEALLPHLATMKQEAQNFRLEGVVAAERGNVDAAITAITNAARLGQLLADEPLLISHLVRITCGTIAIEGTEHLLLRQSLTPAQLARLDAMFNEMKAPGALHAVYLSERAMDLGVFDLPGDALARLGASTGDGLAAADYQRTVRFMQIIGLAGADRRLLLETYDEAIPLAGQDTPSALARCREVFANAASAARRFPPNIFSGMLLAALERVPNKFATLEARRRAAVTAIAVQRYRLEHQGRLPEQLDELLPHLLTAIPPDPFDGKPLRYQRKPSGFVVYSIGADGRDNGGMERPEKGQVKEFDDTFSVGR